MNYNAKRKTSTLPIAAHIYGSKIAAILSAIGVLICTTACGESSVISESSPSSSESSISASTSSNAESTASRTDEDSMTQSEATVQADAETTAPPADNSDYAFSEIIIVDNDKCVFKITEIDEDNIWGYTLKAYIENKTADKTMMFTVNDVAVNGIMCDPFWAKSVMPSSKSNEEISFSDTTLADNGITEITEITGTYRVYDSNDWLADDFAQGNFTIYPKGEEQAQAHQQTVSADGEVLFDTESCKMIVTGYDEENIWGYTVKVYLENKTDKNLMFSIDDATVNGFSADPLWAESVAAGKSSFEDISWSASDFETNGITKVETIKMVIHVKDEDDWLADYLINDTYTVNP